ncbi:metallophosphoesterase family protein [Ruegeria arenilitoris]|uniref:metallophosphoesterase family protein n=2 Tax=Ruegeria arenilitoris TaxID=1173585 RepID=UPI0020C30437|nr:metallophosphoesterase family protein [Ruegeria arenilitoris]
MGTDMTSPIYAIGDIHGQLDMLRDALNKIELDGGPDARVVFLGDYVDRGPDSRGVLDLLIEGKREGRNWVMLLGNHDRMFSYFMCDYPVHDAHLLVGYHWFHERLGGIQTMESYGISVSDQDRLYEVHARAVETVPQDHVAFLRDLPLYHREDELLFVHAGIRPGVELADQSEEDLVWIRQEFLANARSYPWLVVHGHTPVQTAEHYGNRVNLDAGAGYGRLLATAVFEGRKCWLLTEAGRVPLEPSPV